MQLVSWRLDLLLEAQLVDLFAQLLIQELFVAEEFLQEIDVVLEFEQQACLLVAAPFCLLLRQGDQSGRLQL